ncbi:MAG TPA: DUF885 domain-containing protein [Candidatus Eisenbacteria bacterium]|jgi:uncharacterized protein (DUF885 family)
MKLRLVTLFVAAGLALGFVAPLTSGGPEARLARLGDEFLDGWLERRPHLATRLGMHDWDGRLQPVTAASVAADLRWLAAMRERLGAIPRDQLSFERAQEYDLLAARLERERIELAEVRSWERNPGSYLDLVAGSVLAVLERDHASPCERVVLAARRLRVVPEVLRAARVNLKNPPRLYTEVAISGFTGALAFYRTTLPALTEGCHEPRLQADLAEADSQAVHAVEKFLAELSSDVLPQSNGAVALGRDLYQRKLAADEMESAPLDSLLQAGWAALEETRKRMAVVSERITPGLPVEAALESLARDAPGPRELVPFVASTLDTIRAFLRGHALLTPPAAEDLVVRETPPFRRSLSFASMDAPGVWERRATRAFFDVTPAESGWSEQDRRDHLAFFNRAAAQIVAIHEALPGHYWQLLALQHVPSRLRQALRCGTATEGWAHYCEQMMVEEGYGNGDPRIELAQLELALRRIGRLIVGISLHTGGMSLEDAARLFEERCYMAPVNAAREARRGALDPTYLVYTLGKWRILAMRDEARRMLGPAFRLGEFHDALLHQGGVPLPLAREGVLAELARRHRAAVEGQR